jgi:hypothetical protein
LQTLIPRGFHSRRQAAKIPVENFPGVCAIIDLPRARVVIESSPEPPRHHRVLPWASAPSFPTTVEALTCRHLPRHEPVAPSTTQAPSPSPRRYSRARNNIVLPEPTMLCTPRRSRARDANDPRPPQVHSAIVLPDPVMSRARNVVVPVPFLSPQCRRPPLARKATLYIFLYHFGPTNPDFDMLHCHIALICYIAFVLLHCFDTLHCIFFFVILGLRILILLSYIATLL